MANKKQRKALLLGSNHASEVARVNFNDVNRMLRGGTFVFDFHFPQNIRDPRWWRHEKSQDDSFKSIRVSGDLQVKFFEGGDIVCSFDMHDSPAKTEKDDTF